MLVWAKYLQVLGLWLLSRGRSIIREARLKITVSVVQFRPWAPHKALQHRYLEAAGGWALARASRPGATCPRRPSGLPRGVSNLTRGSSGLTQNGGERPPGANGLTRGSSDLTRGADGSPRGSSRLTRGASGLTQGSSCLPRRANGSPPRSSGLTRRASGLTRGSRDPPRRSNGSPRGSRGLPRRSRGSPRRSNRPLRRSGRAPFGANFPPRRSGLSTFRSAGSRTGSNRRRERSVGARRRSHHFQAKRIPRGSFQAACRTFLVCVPDESRRRSAAPAGMGARDRASAGSVPSFSVPRPSL